MTLQPSHIIISPGPCSPTEAGISTELIRRFGSSIPILGVCLGHQCIGAAYGGEIVRAGRPMHGKTSRIHHQGEGIFAGLPSPFLATRYHSLVIAPESVPPELRRHGDRRGRRDHGGGPCHSPGGRRTVPPRVGTYRARVSYAGPVSDRRPRDRCAGASRPGIRAASSSAGRSGQRATACRSGSIVTSLRSLAACRSRPGLSSRLCPALLRLLHPLRPDTPTVLSRTPSPGR